MELDPEARDILALLFDEQNYEMPPGLSDAPVYVISVAAELVGVHAQTLRHYERLGLVEPARSGGNIRLYSARDVHRLRTIVRLTAEYRVNLAGIEVILNMRRRIEALEADLERMRAEMRLIRGYLLEDRRGR
jgi:MerR family transcriptional regulator/heat shock protein HspR